MKPDWIVKDREENIIEKFKHHISAIEFVRKNKRNYFGELVIEKLVTKE